MKTKKEIIAVIAFVLFGFFCAFFLFRFLTSRSTIDKLPLVAAPLPLAAKPTLPPVDVLVKSLPPDPKCPGILPEAFEKAKLYSAAIGSKRVPSLPTSLEKVKKHVIAEEEAGEVIFPPLRVNGIFSSKEGNIALINDVVMREGDVILGVKVLRIYTNYVELEMKGQTKIVRIK